MSSVSWCRPVNTSTGPADPNRSATPGRGRQRPERGIGSLLGGRAGRWRGSCRRRAGGGRRLAPARTRGSGWRGWRPEPSSAPWTRVRYFSARRGRRVRASPRALLTASRVLVAMVVMSPSAAPGCWGDEGAGLGDGGVGDEGVDVVLGFEPAQAVALQPAPDPVLAGVQRQAPAWRGSRGVEVLRRGGDVDGFGVVDGVLRRGHHGVHVVLVETAGPVAGCRGRRRR